VDAVGADQDIAARGRHMRARAVEEPRRDAALVLPEGAEAAAGTDRSRAEAFTRRLMDDALQTPAMDRELRHVVAGVEAARLAPDLLAEAVGVDQLVGPDRDRVEPLHQAELAQFLDGVRQRVDADAELADGFGLLEDFAVDAARVQHQCRRKPANSTADDDRLHAARLRHTLIIGVAGAVLAIAS
jgi:hypothetical protein